MTDSDPWGTTEDVDWPESTEYPSETNPFHHDYELAANER